MLSKFNSVSLMGVSNPPEIFLSEKDLKTSMDFNFLVTTPALEFDNDCQIAPFVKQEEEEEVVDQDTKQKQKQKKHEDHQEGEKDDDDKCQVLVSSLKLKLPSKEGTFKFKLQKQEEEEEDSNDGLKTPTSLDQKIPVILTCPPAPRKPKSVPSSTKRKAPHHQQQQPRRCILLDLSKEIESLFPPALVADLGGKIKKVRQESSGDTN